MTTGFSAHWLDLREEVDHASRDQRLAAHVADHLARHPVQEILDIGCGTGSNLRALAPALGLSQHWHLVDMDAELLKTAKVHLREWADYAEVVNQGLVLYWGEQVISVAFSVCNVRDDLDSLLKKPPQLVTAAAFFDLVSYDWIEQFVARLARDHIPFYTVLTYDGIETWQPPYPCDDAILDAFHEHQGTDKGFGPAAGPVATAYLKRCFAQEGYAVSIADSAWELNAAHHGALMLALGEGIGEAAAHYADPDLVKAWRDALPYRRHAEIGHKDLFARPVLD